MTDTTKSTATQSERPIGITILGISFIVVAILMSIAAAMIGTFMAMLGSYSSMMNNMISAMGGSFVVFIGILAGIEFTIAYALFSGKSWGRITVIVLSIVDFLIHCATLVIGNLFAIPHIVLDVIVFFYMWKPSVVSYFDREKSKLV
ncbi:MAG: hypothetical protein XU09_C0001G0076 [Thaumarchaeota archaeon CSP1-1]|nr:MAG: hypothetical protein XU09_C0001G0076 [Thaumarchaeota archaeon CSP1-1]